MRYSNQVEIEYPDHLADESRRSGSADGLFFPETLSDVKQVFKDSGRAGVTIQGGLTGISAGAVASGGVLMSLERMAAPLKLQKLSTDHMVLSVQPGMRLEALRRLVASWTLPDHTVWDEKSSLLLNCLQSGGEHWFFPSDLTETTASLGGMVSNNASGARSYKYGAVREHIYSLKLVLADGDVLALRRGQHYAEGRNFKLTTERGRIIAGRLPDYEMPAVKHAAGYYVRDNMDLMDLFIGAEGTLGAIVEIGVSLRPAPEMCLGITCFPDSDEQAVMMVECLRTASLPLAALEYFDSRSLELLAEERRAGRLDFPDFGSGCALYCEMEGEPAAVEAAVETCAELLEDCGCSIESAWIADSERDLVQAKAFRHAVPETVNRMIGERKRTIPDLTKLGTDMAVPSAFLSAVMKRYSTDLQSAGLQHVMFGHIGDNHVHVNILPQNMDQLEQGRRLYQQWAEYVVSIGGTVSAEHGIGKLKCSFLEQLFGAGGIGQMRDLKKCFDPNGCLNRGNLFPWFVASDQ